MSRRKLLGIVSLAVLTCGAAISPLFTSVVAYGQQQEQSQSQQQTSPPTPSAPATAATSQPLNPDQPAPKKKKVWTNDEVLSLRTAADNYQLEKEREAAAAVTKAATPTPTNSDKEAAPNLKLPATADETQRMITGTEDDIAEETVILSKMREEFENTPAEQKPEKQRQIDRLSLGIDTSRKNLKALQDHLQALAPEPR